MLLCSRMNKILEENYKNSAKILKLKSEKYADHLRISRENMKNISRIASNKVKERERKGGNLPLDCEPHWQSI